MKEPVDEELRRYNSVFYVT